MGGSLQPAFEATVSPELLRLFAAARGGEQQDAAPPAAEAPPDPSHSPQPEGVASSDASDALASDMTEPALDDPEPRGPDWPPVVLRRDGAWPLVVQAAPVWEDTVELAWCEAGARLGAIQRRVRLFVDRSGRLIAQVILAPAAGLAARAIHRVAYLDDAGGFHRLLAENGPSACFAVSPFGAPRGASVASLRFPAGTPPLLPPTEHA